MKILQLKKCQKYGFVSRVGTFVENAISLAQDLDELSETTKERFLRVWRHMFSLDSSATLFSWSQRTCTSLQLTCMTQLKQHAAVT